MTSLVLLCGGRSRRMGRPKALLPFGGETLLERTLSRLGPLFGELIVVNGPHVALPELGDGVRVVVDRTPDAGPLAALVDGLEAARGETCFVTACDQPFLNPGLVKALAARVDGEVRAAVPEWRGRLQPLCAAYSRSLAAPLAEAVADGDRQLTRAVATLPPALVCDAEIHLLDPGGWSFFDLDSPAAYALALRRALREPMVPRIVP